MEPKISIIIPVYNVEKYLAECLDSVVNQTLREIQIICVNDGSTDNSGNILQEYADRDSRIEIIDKPNGGQASARNLAYSYIKGKYTLCVDSDDWIEPDLCEKTYRKAEETDADMVYFFFLSYNPTGATNNDWNDWDDWVTAQMRIISPGIKTTVEEKMPVLDQSAAWCKIFRTDFLLDNEIYYPEGLAFEDAFVNWKAVILSKRICFLFERFYHYRYNPNSTIQSVGERAMHHIPIYDKVREFLVESGNYATYRDRYMRHKFRILFHRYLKLPKGMQARYVAMIRDSMTDDDWEYCRTATNEQLTKTIRLFYAMLGGGIVDTVKFYIARCVDLSSPYIAQVPGARFTVRRIIRPLLKRMAR